MKKYNTARQATGGNTSIIRCMRSAYWIHRAADTHSEYIIYYCFFTAKWLSERSLLWRLYVHCLSC